MGDSGKKLGCAVAATAACALTTALAIPFLVLAAGGIGRSNGESCEPTAGEVDAPTILGPALLDAEAIANWWTDAGRGQPAGLDPSVAELAGLYLDEGDAEGVRGDLAFAQAVHETGYFTSTDIARNNFAGIAHPDGARAGWTFPSVEIGVRAHIQLLKKYAAGNDAPLASPDVAPAAGASARTWADLAGTWATDPNYWQSISTLYTEISGYAHAPLLMATTDPCQFDHPTDPPAPTPTDGPIALATVRGITVNATIADQLDDMLAAAETDGLLLNGSGYRSHARQIELRRAHCGTSNYAIYEMPSGQCSPPTARPGSSQHELGLAIDFANCSTHSTACWQWLNKNAADFGFYELVGGREPWHWSPTGS